MRFKLEIELGNAAMRKPRDVAAALKRAAEQIEQENRLEPLDTKKIRDINGNSVGFWAVMDDWL